MTIWNSQTGTPIFVSMIQMGRSGESLHPHDDLAIHYKVTDTRQNTVNTNLDTSNVLSSDAKTKDLSLNCTDHDASINEDFQQNLLYHY